MVKYQIIFWRDIPVQVRIKEGRQRTNVALTDRFQQAVYRAAYRGKVIHGDAYLNEWQPSPWQSAAGTAAEIGRRLATELEAEYDDQRLDQLARNKGYEPDRNETTSIEGTGQG